MTEAAQAERLSRADDALKEALDRLGQLVREALKKATDNAQGPAPLPEAIAYAVLGGGKHLRPALTLAACAAAGGNPPNALGPGTALEFIHAYSLVHDDLPSMDNDVERRGQPTVHVKYGEGIALLVGDALLTLAFEHLAHAPGLDDSQRVRCIQILARSAGITGMIGGQVLDIDSTLADEEALQEMHRGKTGALFVAACEMGAIAAGASAESQQLLKSYGEHFGAAFQLVDDLIDALESSEVSEHEAQVNHALRFGPQATQERIAQAIRAAKQALEPLEGDRELLYSLVDWLADRAAAATGAPLSP